MSWGWAEPSFLYTHSKIASLQGPPDLEKCPGALQPPKHKLIHVQALPLLFGMILTTLEQDSFILVLAVMRSQPNSEPDYRKLAFVPLRPHKSYIGAVYFAPFSPPLSNIQEWVCPAEDMSLMSRIA